MPIIQGGQFSLREEERALSLLFQEFPRQSVQLSHQPGIYSGPLIDLTSGYFGLYDDYCQLILQSSVRCRIIAASPKVCLS